MIRRTPYPEKLPVVSLTPLEVSRLVASLDEDEQMTIDRFLVEMAQNKLVPHMIVPPNLWGQIDRMALRGIIEAFSIRLLDEFGSASGVTLVGHAYAKAGWKNSLPRLTVVGGSK